MVLHHEARDSSTDDECEGTTSTKDFKKMIFHSTSQSSTLHFTDKDFMCKAMKERNYNFNVKTFKLCNWCMEDFNSNDCKHQVKSDIFKK